MKKSKLIGIVILAVFILGGCTQYYTVPVNITDVQKTELEQKVSKWDELIKNPPASQDVIQPVETSQLGNLEVTSTYKNDGRPDFDYFVEKARALEELGRIEEAIITYQDGLKLYEISSVGWNNIAQLYEKMNNPTKAAEYYLKLVDTFKIYENYLKLANIYLKLGNNEKAKEYYSKYKETTKNTDDALEKIFNQK